MLRHLTLITFLALGALFVAGAPLAPVQADEDAPPTSAAPGAADPISAEERAETQRVVDELRALTSEIRGLRWKQRVPVELLTREQTRQKMLDSIQEELPEDELEAANRMLKRLKMIGPDDDILTIAVDMISGSAGGFFDPDEKKFFIVAGQSPESQRPVIIHELLHALEDQYIDLKGTSEALEKDPDQTFAFKCMIEGSAEIARLLYEDRFPEAAVAHQDGMRKNTELMQGQMRAILKTPAFMILPMQLHYRVGPSFVSQALAGRNYVEAMANLYEDQPVSQEQVLHPRKFLGPNRDYPQTVVWGGDFAEIAGENWTELDEFTNGELDLALWLDFHLSPDGGKLNMIDSVRGTFVVEDAWRAAVGWDAGKHVFLDRDGEDLAFISAYAFDTKRDAQEAFDAILAVLKKTHGDGYTELARQTATAEDDRAAVDYACPIGKSRILRRGNEILIADGLPESIFDTVWPAVASTTFVKDARDTWDDSAAPDPFEGFQIVNRRRGVGVKLPNALWSENAKANRMGSSNPTYISTVERGNVAIRITAMDQGASLPMLPSMMKMVLGPMGDQITKESLKPAKVMGTEGLYFDLAKPGSGGVRRLYAGSDGHRTLIVVLRGGATDVAAAQDEIDAIIGGVRSVLSY